VYTQSSNNLNRVRIRKEACLTNIDRYALSKYHNPLILHTGNPLTSKWAAENVPAILQAWYPGQEGGKALAGILFGSENPSGKLPMETNIQAAAPVLFIYSILTGIFLPASNGTSTE